ncbi:MAG: nucleotidyl transferase AbiEii/AbiGii toxin family protein [Thermoguttaceae bacterium]|jgi:predicted nucleotidyltransferase component of viral defense system
MDITHLQEMKKLVILALFSNDELAKQLVLKGGNVIDIVYGLSTRPSKDIDFSMCGKFEDIQETQELISQALRVTFAEHGYVVFDVNLREEPTNLTENMKEFWGGYKIDFKVIGKELFDKYENNIDELRKRALPMIEEGGRKFPIEISKYEYCEEKDARIVDDFTVYVYTPSMLVSEKLRALCQQMNEYRQVFKGSARARGRDFFDIWLIVEHFHIDFEDAKFHSTLKKVFAAKQVPLRLIGKLGDPEVRDFHGPDFASVIDTIVPDFDLQSFEYYYDFVLKQCEKLKSLWDE